MFRCIYKINIERKDLHTKVWRYLNFSGLVSLLETSSLHFSHVSAFEDKYDGILNCLGDDDYYCISGGKIVKVAPSAVDSIAADSTTKMKQLIIPHYRAILGATGVNCWRIDEQESHAMWRVFLKSDEGVAIETTLTNLTNSVSPGEYKLSVGKVQYIDYSNEKIPIHNLFNAFFYKSRHFEHEKELRLICYTTDCLTKDPPAPQNYRPLPEDGLLLPVNLSKLITAIHVSPYAQKWFFNLVALVAKKYRINVPIRPSVIALNKKV